MLMALSMATLHSLFQDNLNEVPYDLFGHVIPLILLSVLHDVTEIINSTITFPTSR